MVFRSLTLVFCFAVGIHELLFLASVNAAPVAAAEEDKSVYDRIEKINKKNHVQELFEGDIVYNEFVREVVNNSLMQNSKRETKRYLAALWRTRVVPYEISSDFSSMYKDAITRALKIFEDKTCLRFKPHTTESNWIKFVMKDGCYSSVGRNYLASGSQDISLGRGCLGQSTILHEVMHALGFWHEQSRPDRDKYVEIFWENIISDQAYNFDRYSHQSADQLGVGYDYQTLMHYGKKAFTKNGLDTIRAIGNNALELGQSLTLSATDITQINALYDCANANVSIWSSWSQYGPCDSNCSKTRQRFCSHDNLANCHNANPYGIETQYLQCSSEECNAPVDGHWGRWGSWSACSHKCGSGKQNRTRVCNDPAPKNGGKACSGDSLSYQDCLIMKCGLGKYDCEYDGQNWCSWKVDTANKASYTWTRIKGQTPSRNTGPTGDHTSGAGHYIYTEASAPAVKNDKARVISEQLPATNGMCLSFWYHMYGLTMGSLKAYVRNSDNVDTEIWSKSGDQGNRWNYSNKTIISKTPFKVIFESTNGYGYLSDIALDDINFKERPCEKYKIEAQCGVDMKPVGCFKDLRSDRVLKQFVASYRDGGNPEGFTLDWNNYQQSLDRILCYCAEKAKAGGFKYYGIQYFGECWAGASSASYSKYGSSSNCVDGKYSECSTAKDMACTGEAETNFVYELL